MEQQPASPLAAAAAPQPSCAGSAKVSPSAMEQQPASPFAAAAAPQPSCAGGAEVSPSAILLPSQWKAETGAELWEGTVLGKQLGAGVQVRQGGMA